MLLDICTCPMCRTVYERHKERRREKERGSFTCSCGHVVARWNGFAVPIFTPWVETPESSQPLEALSTEEPIDLQKISGRIGESLKE
jgi:hypothetical protein